MKKITTVMFDFDGTIMDTNQIILDSWHHTFRHFKGEEPDDVMLLEHFGEPLELSMKIFFGAGDDEIDEYIRIYRSYQTEHFKEDIKLFPGVPEMLGSLRDAGYTLALVTSRLESTTMAGVEKFRLDRFFDLIVTANACTRHKPDPQPIEITLKKLDVSKAEAVMVGDTVMDIGCAKNAGVASVLVSWSMALPPSTASGAAAPDYILDSAEGMLPLIERINASR